MAVNIGNITSNKIDDDCDGNGMVRLSRLHVSRVFHALRASIDRENERSFAPPPAISFGGVKSSNGMDK